MKKGVALFVFLLFSSHLFAPPNCEVYKEDEDCYESCKQAIHAIRYKQGSYQSQKFFDHSLSLCPSFAYSHMEKAVPFLKRGLFIEWKQMIDKALALSPEEYLGYRGWCRLQFLRDYKGAIADIEALKSLVDYDIGYCQTGDYHLNIALGLCYKELGEFDKARALMRGQLDSEGYSEGLYDYYHLGVLEFELGNFEEAIFYFDKQIEVNDYLAETYFFRALAYKGLRELESYRRDLEQAEVYYQKGFIRSDTYTEMIDKIYMSDILEEKEKEL